VNNTYLLIAGTTYYPQPGTMDWVGCFTTYEEAYKCVKHVTEPLKLFTKGPRKGQPKPNQIRKTHYVVTFPQSGEERIRNWFTIIDLTNWITCGYD
jgi:hypothetical protein